MNRELLQEWVYNNSPGAIAKLAVKSEVAFGTIQRISRSKEAPKKLDMLTRLSKAMGVRVDDLFPPVKGSKS